MKARNITPKRMRIVPIYFFILYIYISSYFCLSVASIVNAYWRHWTETCAVLPGFIQRNSINRCLLRRIGINSSLLSDERNIWKQSESKKFNLTALQTEPQPFIERKKIPIYNYNSPPPLYIIWWVRKILNFPVLNQEERQLSPIQFCLSLTDSRNQKKKHHVAYEHNVIEMGMWRSLPEWQISNLKWASIAFMCDIVIEM